jgi:SOS-response transcriptional repressor LexA
MTPKQKQCLDFIKRYAKSNGCSPSYQEIADYLGIVSKSNVFSLIKNLKEQGYIEDKPHKHRSISVVSPCKNCQRLEKQLKIAVADLYVIANNRSPEFNCIEYANETLNKIKEVR